MKLSVVIPCFNESANLESLLSRCHEVGQNKDIEFIIVDNGSNDNTGEILGNLLPLYSSVKSIRLEVNRGYGFGIISGLRQASGQILSWTHADLQTDPMDAVIGLQLFVEYGQGIFVKGRRYGRPFSDIAFTAGMSIFETVLLRQRMWDINAQPTMFTRVFFESWQDPPDDFSIDLYAYAMAARQGLVIKRFPVRFGKRKHGISTWNVDWSSKFKFISRTIRYSLALGRRW